ncbi:nitrite reductase (NAD(P)H) small subunit [Brachybacterium sp. EF45031]|uniref:nitrite reductase (NAD(P)H) small subunit n=1 Tax=Brachybacterium sillae TaxID=2810536 RepID=UPI00217DBEEC|nr:nitrite reductase (NAD(P)H) small subunit [Brachybacterium sillae]MCS6710878.1 nitrite reductase (NAD(P)H) small subunit [Brachybacterium sillae]
MATTEMIAICPLSALSVDRGAAALLPDGTQIGVFLLEDGSVHAIQQRDPYSGANILSRGLVGTHEVRADDGTVETVRTIASPMYKQVWNLDTGEVIDAGGKQPQAIAVFDAEERDGHLYVASSPHAATDAAAPATGDATPETAAALPTTGRAATPERAEA